MSLETLAGLTGRSKGWLSKIENGHSRLERRQDIAAIASALEVSADGLLGEPAPEIRPGGQMYNITPLQRALLDAAPDDPPDIPARSIEALACAVQNDHRGAAEQAAEAARLANRDGERPGAWELFGPANVGVWRTTLAVEAGEAEDALAYADQVEPGDLGSHNRRASLHLEKARAFAILSRDAAAIRELRQAERLSPAQTRNQPLIRDLVLDMLARARREAGGRDLRGLAWRMNLI